MPPSTHQEVRPRTTGEILDDAWRLYLSNPPLLLALYGLFLVPASAVLLLLLTQSSAGGWTRFLWPALAAVLLPLTGLGAGACEEAYHLWTEARPVTFGNCLRPALRRGLNHVATQALSLLVPMIAVLCLAVPELHVAVRWVMAFGVLALNLPVWIISLCRHAVLTSGQKNLWRSWRSSRRASGRQPGKAIALVFSRVVFLLVTILNLHLFVTFACYAGEQLAGFDLAYVNLQLSLGNPIYLVVVLALAWWLLAPWNEAVNYLFLVDARTRYEGLDLWYRIEQFFPAAGKAQAGALLLVALGAVLLTTSPVSAGERLQAVESARKELADIAAEIKQTEPYPGGKRWRVPLHQVGERLDPQGDAQQGRYRWFHKAADRLGKGDRTADLEVLRELDSRLDVVEQTLKRRPPEPSDGAGVSAAQIHKLVPGERQALAPNRPQEKPPKVEQDKPKADDRGNNPHGGAFAPPKANVGLVAPQLAGGLGYFLLFLFAGLMAAVILVALVLLVRNWRRNRKQAPRPEQGVRGPEPEDLLQEPDKQNVASLWRQADELARAGRFLEAVRTLYLAVLALLHQSNLIRYERTRTNGEYADQLRRRGPVHTPFVRLTGMFELKWYGERSCQAGDYQQCRGLADTISGAAQSEPEA